ncbi:cytochrome c oxidase subunit II [Alicyclobacillus sp.]|uniref:cytochrome c oxidase subunit II n=1 Tax=Alicyclobacillus sp. TaxID=61169 RepID=UPI0025BA853D|nr:cytochrome c oxidase subunit II [Alicyclobacillus sp.]MCL6517217.1 cytochrome c oxidase subunit II [Alicyclobacillus sp.]
MKRTQLPKSNRVLALAALTALLVSGCGPEYLVLNPAGPVAREELHLIELSTVLVLIVIIPVLALLAYIVWRYRDKPDNKAPYTPKWSESKALEVVWWGIPVVIVAVLGYYTGKSTFNLTEPPQKDVQPLTVQVTSLNWKWLFQYPGQNVATVNYVEIPVGVPIQFELTADAPMNSFWVPELGGQEYTMPGMAMRLWLEADKPGTYYGSGANFTGKGFAHMNFTVKAVSQDEFDQWVKQIKSNSPALTMTGYEQLKQPSVVGTMSYSSYPPGLFHDVVWADGGRYMPDMMNDMTGMQGQTADAAKPNGAATDTAKSPAGDTSSMPGMQMDGGQSAGH